MNIWKGIYKKKRTRTLVEKFNSLMRQDYNKLPPDYIREVELQLEAIREILVKRKIEIYGPYSQQWLVGTI